MFLHGPINPTYLFFVTWIIDTCPNERTGLQSPVRLGFLPWDCRRLRLRSGICFALLKCKLLSSTFTGLYAGKIPIVLVVGVVVRKRSVEQSKRRRIHEKKTPNAKPCRRSGRIRKAGVRAVGTDNNDDLEDHNNSENADVSEYSLPGFLIVFVRGLATK